MNYRVFRVYSARYELPTPSSGADMACRPTDVTSRFAVATNCGYSPNTRMVSNYRQAAHLAADLRSALVQAGCSSTIVAGSGRVGCYSGKR